MLEPIDALISWQAVSRPPLLPTVAGARAIDRRTENEKPLSRKQVMVYIYNIYIQSRSIRCYRRHFSRPDQSQRSAAQRIALRLSLRSRRMRARAQLKAVAKKARQAKRAQRRPGADGLSACADRIRLGRSIRAAVACAINRLNRHSRAAMSDRSAAPQLKHSRRSHLSECTRCAVSRIAIVRQQAMARLMGCPAAATVCDCAAAQTALGRMPLVQRCS
jgi:hypothetical protein